MPGSSKLREEGDFFPSFLNQTPPDPAHEQTPAQPKRSLTPRGHIFRDFGEAHRNITGSSRFRSNNPFTTPTHDSNNDIPLQDLSSPSLPNGNGKMLGDQPHSSSDFVLAYPQRSDNGRSLTHNRPLSQSSSMCAFSSAIEDVSSVSSAEVECETTAKNQNIGASKSTVGKILDQYVETGFGRRPSHTSLDKGYVLAIPKHRGRRQDVGQPARSHSNSPCKPPSGQDNVRVGSSANYCQAKPLYSTPIHSVSPNKSFSDTPDADARILTRPLSHEDVTITESDPSFIDEDTLRYLRHGHRSLLPMPLRVPSNTNDVFADPVHRPDLNVEEANSSFGGDSFFESDSDPFKYDSKEYRAVLQATREREVSQALEVGIDEDCALTYPGNKTAKKNNVHANHENDKADPRDQLGQSKGSFFDAATLDALHGRGPKPECDEGDIKVIVMALAAQGHVLNNEQAHNHLFGLKVERGSGTAAGLPKEATKEGDWVTEATSEAEFDTGTTAPSSDNCVNRIIKATGSSVADVSEYESDGAPLERFNSRNHFLRHPPGAMNTPPKRYNLRNIKDTNERVMLPRPNVPCANGFAQNSLRIRPDVPFKSNLHPFPPSMRPQISNPFSRRRSGYQRAEPSSYFSYARDYTKSSKYDFRDSGSSYGQVNALNQATGGTYDTLPSTSMGSINTHKVLEMANAQAKASPYDEQPEPDTETQKPSSDHARNIEDAYFDPGERCQPVLAVNQTDDETTPRGSNFPFPLLELREAQDLQRKQRESGVADETEDSTRRYQRAMSGTSGRDTATPTQPRQPNRAYIHRHSSARRFRRASTLSSNFSPPAWLVGRDEFPDTPLSVTGGHGSITPITSFDTASSKAPRFKWFTVGKPQRQPRLLPVDKRARRNGGHAIDEPSITDAESLETDNISPWGCHRRKQFFYMTLVLSILPFFGIMALHGSFNTLLASYTNGKAFRFTKKQRRAIKWVLVAEAIIYIAIAMIVISVQVSKASGH